MSTATARSHPGRWLAGLALAVLLAFGGWWGYAMLDGRDDRPREIPDFVDDYHVAKAFLDNLGMEVVERDGFDPDIPDGARMLVYALRPSVASSQLQFLVPWVERGGHLVLYGPLDELESLPRKLLQGFEQGGPQYDEESDVEASARPSEAGACRTLIETRPGAGTYGDDRVFKVCGRSAGAHYRASAGHAPSWAMQAAYGTEMLRMPVGEGSVTLLGTPSFMYNQQALVEDNALIVAAALQARPGAEVWFVEGRAAPASRGSPSIWGWLWTHAWVALLLALLAIAAAVWRTATRFGPVLPAAPPQRRSMGDQVRGTGQYLRRQGAAALHAAQVRALHETAARVLPRYEALNVSARVHAIAQATGLERGALDRAMARLVGDASAQFETELALLETARRRLGDQADAARRARNPDTPNNPNPAPSTEP